MNYKICPKCGFRGGFQDAMDIYTITDRNVFWTCPKCSSTEQITLTEFISRSEKDKQKASRKSKLRRLSNRRKLSE